MLGIFNFPTHHIKFYAYICMYIYVLLKLLIMNVSNISVTYFISLHFSFWFLTYVHVFKIKGGNLLVGGPLMGGCPKKWHSLAGREKTVDRNFFFLFTNA